MNVDFFLHIYNMTEKNILYGVATLKQQNINITNNMLIYKCYTKTCLNQCTIALDFPRKIKFLP